MNYWIVTDNGESPFIPNVDNVIVLNKTIYGKLFSYSSPSRGISNISISDGDRVLFYQGYCNQVGAKSKGFYYQGTFNLSQCTNDNIYIPAESISPISFYKLQNLQFNNTIKLPHNMSVTGKCYLLSESEYDILLLAGQNDFEKGEGDDIRKAIDSKDLPDITRVNIQNNPYRNGIYSEEECIKAFEDYMNSNESPEYLYRAEKKASFINWRGRAKNSEMSYSDIIAKELLNHLDWLNNIHEIDQNCPEYRASSYFPDSHENALAINPNSNREEAYMAKDLVWGSDYSYVDEQIPLKKDSNMNVDLVKFIIDNGTPTILLMELKRPDRNDQDPESLLRCVLEAYTYLKIINQNKFKNDFITKVSKFNSSLFSNIDINQLKIRTCIYVAKGGIQHRKMLANEIYYQPKVVELMKKLDISAYVYECGNKQTEPDFYPIISCESVILD